MGSDWSTPSPPYPYSVNGPCCRCGMNPCRCNRMPPVPQIPQVQRAPSTPLKENTSVGGKGGGHGGPVRYSPSDKLNGLITFYVDVDDMSVADARAQAEIALACLETIHLRFPNSFDGAASQDFYLSAIMEFNTKMHSLPATMDEKERGMIYNHLKESASTLALAYFQTNKTALLRLLAYQKSAVINMMEAEGWLAADYPDLGKPKYAQLLWFFINLYEFLAMQADLDRVNMLEDTNLPSDMVGIIRDQTVREQTEGEKALDKKIFKHNPKNK